MLIKGGSLVFPKKIVRADVLVENGKIKRVGKKISAPGEKTVSAAGLFILPGLIDVHAHLREPGGTHKEDFFTGTRAALAGGVTTVLCMPNTSPPIDSLPALAEAKKLAEKAVCDVGFYFGASQLNQADAAKAAGDPRVAGLKIYMGSSTGSLLVKDFAPLIQHFASWPAEKPVAVHAEDEDAVKFFTEKAGEEKKSNATALDHNRCRPPVCAEIAVKKAISIAVLTKKRLHVCHVSAAGEIAVIREAKKSGARVTCEATPHHLFLSEDDVEWLKNFGKMNPPLRSREDVVALWKAVEGGVVDCIATDHAPHTRGEKEQHYWDAPAGVPGLETMLPLLLDAVNAKRLTLNKVAELCGANPAKIFGLKGKGGLGVGMDADLVLVDLKSSTKIRADKLFTKCGWSPWEGKTLKGKIKRVLLRGEEVF